MASVPRNIRRRRKNPEGRMAVMDHLRELRRRLIWIVLIVAVGAIVAWQFYNPILRLMEHPYCSVPVKYRFVGSTGKCDLIYHGVLDGFVSRLKVSVIAGAVGTGPFWLYQVWAFIAPGMRKSERKYTIWFVITSTVLFVAGVVLAYLLLLKGLPILMRQAGTGVQAQLTINDYLGFVVLMLVVFGAAFELPLIIVMANLAGILSARVLRKSQRIAIFLIFVFAAVATPTTDPFTMCAMAFAMTALYELAVLFAIVHDRRKARRRAEERAEEHLDDDTPSSVDALPEQIGSGDGWGDTT